MSVRARVISLAISLIAMFAGVSCQRSGVNAAGENSGDLTAQKILSLDDHNFLLTAYKSQTRQKALAQAAIQKSRNADVVELAHQVINDRDTSLENLVRVMKAKQIAEPASVVEDIQLDVQNRLERLSGSEFNDEFISLLAAEQQQCLGNFESASETAADSDVRNYASTTLPPLRQDTDRAAAIEKKLAEKNQR